MSDGSTAGHEDREPESTPAADAGRETGGVREAGDAPDTEDAPDTGTGRDPVDAPDTGTGRDPVGDRDSGTGRKTDTGRDAEGLRETGDGPARLRGLVTPHGQEPKHTHAGNGTVNHGRDDRGPEGLDSDELELRTLLRQAVREVEPGDGTLDYLRRAVPARRARKRQALVGMAAAALFVGTAVPALVHVTTASGSDANPSAVGHASQAQGGTGQGKDPGGGESTAGGSSDEVGGGTEDKEKDEDKDGSSTGSGTGATEGADPSADASDPAPACTAAQLGPAVANSAAPDSTGAVYGSFRVTNISTADCTVEGAGVVGVTPQGAASAAKVGSARHVAGDAAAGLPDPSQEAGQLVLKPGAAYEVQFAWVPSETCPTPGGTPGGGTGGPSPDPTPSGDPTTTTGASEGTDGGTATQTVRADGGTEGSVAVSYTASTGSSSATTTIGNACAGTVYWTGLLTPAG
ncbi:hypothetical protein GCM10010261_48930 [Streptomyces pilosus]|uniref:hypothetical protein n=1 Tax=Streptomyces pilosus TaxID=28893 RepID=UPI0019B8FF6F|nr:hypothetical protein [Streptomyces pilosus]GGV60679.1 hypothetical protein GCM10010261_48930 [Streptomyces pilosus]